MAQKLRHVIYWSFVVVAFVPFMTLAILRTLYDAAEFSVDRVRYWAYQERYAFPYHGDHDLNDPS